jgi:hypothetical protein
MVLGFTQHLTETNTRNLPPGGGVLTRRVSLTSPPSASGSSKKCWILDFSQTYGSPLPITGILTK